ncbi:TolC family protein [Tenacibaculum sp. IB213877]|uniref:TolC family protein n=1 Tax=Tenacibaculum sp. IB213877 TaxID=3097351 RepID=UPI002A5AF840|nr:TolC family protein [Tenacibaculum sp. IB213877]MDY0781465.1 TolC family protein [Tenacibaculum sp. IB213877]
MSLPEFLGYVKLHHPLVKQANITLTQAEAKVLKARGAFDPKIEYSKSTKEFDKKEYYDKQQLLFKIPTWYGIELKGSFEDNNGLYLNPEATVPEDGLYSAGISVPLAKNLLINERMAQLKQAKLFRKQAEAEQQLLVNSILYDATVSYANWLKTYKENLLYSSFLTNAEFRLKGIVKGFEAGDKPAIDTLEASITVSNRKLMLEKNKLKLTKAGFELSNYLWNENTAPVELQPDVVPETNIAVVNEDVSSLLTDMKEDFDPTKHPKYTALQYKQKSLQVEKRLKLNNLLPQVNVEYNFLTTQPRFLDSFTRANYKGGVAVKLPLFLRKERGELKLAKAKLDEVNFEMLSQEVSLKNKFKATLNAVESYKNQLTTTEQMVTGYKKMVTAEERKFSLGDSSLFLINSREAKLIEARLKQIDTENQLLKEQASMLLLVN